MKARGFLMAVAVGAALLIAAGSAIAGVYGTPHDFRGSTSYPVLAQLASVSACAACHAPRTVGVVRDFGNDFPGGIPIVTDPYYQFVNDAGNLVGPRINPTLPQAMRCLTCHDGTIRTATGTNLLPTPDPWTNGPNLDWSTGGAHNIWGMGQDSAFHPVQMHYPPEPAEKVWDGFKTLDVGADNNKVKGSDGRWYIVDPAITTVKLPLVTDPADPNKAYISCITCHNPHDNAVDPDLNFKRIGWPDLCFMCHRSVQ
jgi:predicted CXXCH cytochrome family protein